MTLTRRRFLTVSACALAGSAAWAGEAARWQGVALGAPATMVLAGVSPLEARPVFAALEREITRLERIFSLYRSDSAIMRLNRSGRLEGPPPEMLEVLTLAGAIHEATGGAFDPTVQPLWQACATGADTAAARALIGWRDLRFDARRVAFARPGMALTLNGIAQGYLTDRIAGLLTARGFANVLVDMGEIVAYGRRSDGAIWQAGIADPAGSVVRRVQLSDRAIATSAPMGTRFGNGEGHIIGPSGEVPHHALLSVSAPRAVVADGLSTALCLLDEPRSQRALARFPGACVEFYS